MGAANNGANTGADPTTIVHNHSWAWVGRAVVQSDLGIRQTEETRNQPQPIGHHFEDIFAYCAAFAPWTLEDARANLEQATRPLALQAAKEVVLERLYPPAAAMQSGAKNSPACNLQIGLRPKLPRMQPPAYMQQSG
eukprot:CAMPEP_0180834980 /NCGR_PEP_ID=MMETSP1038_2-20121128/78136_1 /TAXON_ID=632150 /ORGANISM="Azadinium spinosum, Strain 3D9" /LENGTH=136 /DNA_ID=CAMNT_0022878231 /DNA_START=26 /DNA_END=433 /DNA_ORIENTATION=+